MTDVAGAKSTWDFSPFTDPVDPEELRIHTSAARSTAAGVQARRRLPGAVLAFALMAVVGVGSFAVFAALVVIVATTSDPLVRVFGILGAGIFAWCVKFAVDVVLREWRGLSPWKKWYRLERFAGANGLRFIPELSPPPHDGLIFTLGDARTAYDIIQSGSGRPVEIGNYHYVGELGPNRVGAWGYIRIQLDRAVPHMVMESRHNRRGSLPASFSRQQVLSLEGDFDKYFTLFAPQTYKRDALFVFTPDLMALLVDQAASFDLEVVDDQLFLYSRNPFRMLTREPYDLLEHLVRTVGAKSVRQTAKYGDGDPNRLHVAGILGRRLTRRLSPVIVVCAAIYGAVVVLGFAALVVDVLGGN